MDNYIIYNKVSCNEQLGNLSFFEANKDVPFEIKRIYYIYGVNDGIKRGFHAHRNLKQALWCPYGRITIMLDNGKEKQYYELDNPNKMLILKKGYWREMYWKTKDSVLCVAASEHYDESDYIRNYDDYKQLISEGYWNEY